MQITFFGTPEFAVPSLKSLYDAGHDIACVVTKPDARRGRGRKLSPPAVKSAALELNLDVFQPEKVSTRDAMDRLSALEADIGVVVAFGEVFKKEVLQTTSKGFLNLHASLLPKYRGAAPINWALIKGEEKTGVTVQRLVRKLDAGPVLAREEVRIGKDETAGELHDRLAVVGAELLVDTLNRMESGEPVPARRQKERDASFAPMLSKTDGLIDWSLSAQEIRDHIRGVTPWPGAVSHFIGSGREERVILLDVDVGDECRDDVACGTVVRSSENEGIVVRAGDGRAVHIRELKPDSSRAMEAADFIHGHQVKKGDRFEK